MIDNDEAAPEQARLQREVKAYEAPHPPQPVARLATHRPAHRHNGYEYRDHRSNILGRDVLNQLIVTLNRLAAMTEISQ